MTAVSVYFPSSVCSCRIVSIQELTLASTGMLVLLPYAHNTHVLLCRIDLPIYEKEKDFRQAMMLLLDMEITGFTIE